jgi:hypothetical protein
MGGTVGQGAPMGRAVGGPIPWIHLGVGAAVDLEAVKGS